MSYIFLVTKLTILLSETGGFINLMFCWYNCFVGLGFFSAFTTKFKSNINILELLCIVYSTFVIRYSAVNHPELDVTYWSSIFCGKSSDIIKFPETYNPGCEQNMQKFCRISEKCLNMFLVL